MKERREVVVDKSGKSVPNGAFVRWYPNGLRRMEGYYRQGQLDSLVVEYREDMTKQSEILYRGGQRVSRTTFDKRGLEPLGSRAADTVLTRIDEVILPDTSRVRKEGYDGRHGLFFNHGKSEVWYATGEKEDEGSFRDGKLHGLFTRWYKNGRKAMEGSYRDNQEDGHWFWWSEDGKLHREAFYTRGHAVKDVTY